MANKSIIPIEIDDSQFKTFYELFQQFQDKLGELPEDWKHVNETATLGHEAMAGAAGALLESMIQAKEHTRELALNMKDAVEAQKQFRLTTSEGETGLKKMGLEAKELANTIFGIGKFLFKLSVLGLGAAAGGMFGVDKLAERAVSNQRSARGLGLTTGQLRAFQTDFGSRYMDDNVLESVANARNDPTGRVYLQRALNVPDAQIDRTDTGALAAQLAIKVHDWWASTPQGQHNEAFFQSTGFEQSGISLDLARQLGNTNRDELVRAHEQYKTDAGALNVNDRNTDALYGFTRQLSLAGATLETLITNKLSRLGEPLGAFIGSLEKDAEILINGVLTPKNLEAVASGLHTLADYLGGENFKSDVQSFVAGFKKVADTITSFAGTISQFSSDKPPPADANFLVKGWWDIKQAKAANDSFFKDTIGGPVTNWYKNLQNSSNEVEKTSVAARAAKWYAEFTGHDVSDAAVLGAAGPKVPMQQANVLFGKLETSKHLTPGVLSAVAANESGFNPRAVSSKGAQGLFQEMPEVSRALGVQDPFDWIQSSLGAAQLLDELQGRYHGDIKKELAAWNWNPNSVDKDVKAHGDDWQKYLPKETQDFISRVMSTMSRQSLGQQKVEIVVTNKAGANVAISQNAGNS